MSKFNVGDVVRTKPMEIVGEELAGIVICQRTRDDGFVCARQAFFADEIEPLPAIEAARPKKDGLILVSKDKLQKAIEVGMVLAYEAKKGLMHLDEVRKDYDETVRPFQQLSAAIATARGE